MLTFGEFEEKVYVGMLYKLHFVTLKSEIISELKKERPETVNLN